MIDIKANENCARCLYNRQLRLTDNESYLSEIREIIAGRGENDTAPYLVYRFNQVYERYFGERPSYKDVKRQYNDLVLSIEDSLRQSIRSSSEPLEKAFLYARIGNYIDFGAMNTVSESDFLAMLDSVGMSAQDREVMSSFCRQCAEASGFLLIADNCGEIVLDKLFLEQLKLEFPQLKLTVMVRGGEVLNDAAMEDALYVGIDKTAEVISNGNPVSGTVYSMLSDEARSALDGADVILAKGQGNYESMCEQGRHVFYSFLCKCELFTNKFNVPRLTGLFVEEE